MTTEQIKAMILQIAPVIREFVADAQVPLLKRIDELERQWSGRDGKDTALVTDDQVAAAVAHYLDANPPAAGKDGSDGVDGAAGRDGANGKDGRDGVNGAQGMKGEDGRDGVGLAGALIDRAGDLIVTLTSGEHKNLGPVVGKDGRDGLLGEKGAAGRDGLDGLGFDDFDLVEDDRGLTLRFARGAEIKEFPLPTVLDRGVWCQQEYRKGSGVSWGGSWWIAQKDTSAKPDTADSGWRLAVKRGRDGKDGKGA